MLASVRQLSKACRHFDEFLGGFADERLAKNFAMFRFGRAIVARRPHLETADQFVIDVAHDQRSPHASDDSIDRDFIKSFGVGTGASCGSHARSLNSICINRRLALVQLAVAISGWVQKLQALGFRSVGLPIEIRTRLAS